MLSKKIADLESRVAELREAHEIPQRALREHNRILVEALEAVEWVRVGFHTTHSTAKGLPIDVPIYECQWCHWDRDDGHAPDCRRQTALALAKGEE